MNVTSTQEGQPERLPEAGRELKNGKKLAIEKMTRSKGKALPVTCASLLATISSVTPLRHVFSDARSSGSSNSRSKLARRVVSWDNL